MKVGTLWAETFEVDPKRLEWRSGTEWDGLEMPTRRWSVTAGDQSHTQNDRPLLTSHWPFSRFISCQKCRGWDLWTTKVLTHWNIIIHQICTSFFLHIYIISYLYRAGTGNLFSSKRNNVSSISISNFPLLRQVYPPTHTHTPSQVCLHAPFLYLWGTDGRRDVATHTDTPPPALDRRWDYCVVYDICTHTNTHTRSCNHGRM